ncbi:MAG: peptide-methionine (S)-S-oxide reductase [Natronomonas sp.]
MPLSPTTIEAYDRQTPPSVETATATFGLGCFWGPDARFGAMDGVVRTRVGYAGGTKSDPTYHALGDHTEVLRVEYDPAELSYADLLELFFQSHDPRRQRSKPQYQTLLLIESESQRDALGSYLAERDFDAATIETRIEPLSRFYPAEDYHQKYTLRGTQPLISAFEDAGYDDEEIRDSPAAATLNGYAAGHDPTLTGGLEVIERSQPGR